MERLGHRPCDVLGLGDQEVVLGDRQGDAGDVGFLETVGADQAGRHLAGDGDHRHRVHVGVGQRGHQVGRAGPRCGHADPRAPGHLRVSGGRVTGALLVADQDVPDRGRVEERVVQRQDGTSRDAEHDVHTQPLQRPDQGRGACHPGACRGGGLAARRGVTAVGRVGPRARVRAGPLAGRSGRGGAPGWAGPGWESAASRDAARAARSRGVGLEPFRAVPASPGPGGAAVVWSVIASFPRLRWVAGGQQKTLGAIGGRG